MSRKKLILFSFVFISAWSSCHAFGIDDAAEVLNLVKDVVQSVGKTWKYLDEHSDLNLDLPVGLFGNKEEALFTRIGTVISILDDQAENMDVVGTSVMVTMLRSLPDRLRLEMRLNELMDYLTRLDVHYRNFQNYVDRQQQFERITLEDFAKIAISHDSSSVASLVERIHSFIAPGNSRATLVESSILNLLSKALQEVEGTMLCETKQSNQLVMYNLYNTIALTELKGYSMIQFSYMLLRLYGKGNFTTESRVTRNRYEEMTNNAAEIVRSALTNSSRELWMCDPQKYVAGKTYQEVTQLLQGYVQNEVDLNPDETCRENCAEYTYTKSHGCFKNLYCNQQRSCSGKIINCQFFDSDMWICPADPKSGRRYEYIEYENGRVLGRKQGCHRGSTKVDSWWRWLFWHCSYCFCLCDEQGRFSDRYFNMRPVLADINDNKVVTGLKFNKTNRIIHLQIQQGVLLPEGNIDVDTLEWKPVEMYQITDRDVYSGKDYHTMSWEKRALDLDDLEADEGYLLTGVRFKEIGSHLNFEIHVTSFDFGTGKLHPEKSIWKDNPNTDSSFEKPRTKVPLFSPDIPTRSPLPSMPDSASDQYIEFIHSDINRDVAQTTVPFLDVQKVSPLHPVPLAGAGLYHKGRRNFGGFVAPKVFTYDFSKHIKAAFPKEEVN